MPTVTLTWDDINDNEDGFRIYRDTAPLDTASPENLPEPLATVAAGVGTYDDTTAAADATYYYSVAAYKGDFVNPATDFSVSTTTDPYWGSVSVLLHFDGEEGSTTILDEKGGSWTAKGDAALSTDSPAFGTASLVVNNTGSAVANSLVSRAVGPGVLFGSGDFTVEASVRLRASPSNTGYVVCVYEVTANQRSWALMITSDLRLEFNVSSDGSGFDKLGTSPSTLSVGVDYHIAATRQGDDIRMFLDGILVDQLTYPQSLYDATVDIAVGARSDDTYGIDGFADEVRITKGVARYIADFTPPSLPHPNG